MVEVMTEKQFKTILEMVDMILDGCKDLAEAKEKVKRLIDNQSGGTHSSFFPAGFSVPFLHSISPAAKGYPIRQLLW